MAKRIDAISATYPWLVATGDPSGAVLGYAYASRHRERPGYRWSVDVAVYLARGRWPRIGRLLYGRLLPLLEAQGFHRAYAGIALPNDASVGLHRAMGFEPVGTYREVGYKLGAWLDVQWWTRQLAESAFPRPSRSLWIAFRRACSQTSGSRRMRRSRTGATIPRDRRRRPLSRCTLPDHGRRWSTSGSTRRAPAVGAPPRPP